MSAEAYRRDSGGVARKALELWLRDSGGVARKGKEVWLRDAGGVARLVFSGAVYSAISGSATRNETASGSKTATLTINRAGTWQLTTNGAGGTTISPSGVQTWVVPNAVDSGDTRWVRVTLTGDATSGSAVSTVLALSANQSWTQGAITSGDSFSSTLTVNIYGDAGATVLLSTGTVTLTAVKG